MITLRSFLIGIICVVVLCALTPYNNHYVSNSSYPSSNHLPLGPLFFIVILIFLFNIALSRVHSRWKLGEIELVTIWCMMAVAVAIPSKAFAEYLLPDLVAPYYLATPENEWVELFHQYIPSWLAVSDGHAVSYFYKGSPPRGIPWGAWLKPLLAWSAYALGLYFMMYCMSVILRKQWVENERITFPLAQLPAEMIGIGGDGSSSVSFFRNHGMWIGFIIAGLINALNGLNTDLPVIPRIPTNFSLDSFLTDRPWNALRPFPLTFQPSVIGVTYLLTLRVSFSAWFFYLFYKFQVLMGTVFGVHMPNSPGELGYTHSFASHQDMGAFIVVTIFLLWRGKRHLKNVVKGLLVKVDDSGEPLSYRWAVIGLLMSILLQIILSQFMGMTFLFASFTALAFGIMCLIFTWRVASAGILRVDSTFDPAMMLITTIGGRRIGPGNFTIDSIQARGFRTDISQLPMPSIMNVFKISGETKVNKRLLSLALFVSIILALVVSCYFFVSLSYKHGGENLSSWNYQGGPWSAYTALASRITNPAERNWTDASFILVGAAFASFVMFMYHRFLWWPFHPIGCTTGSSWGIQMMLFSIFLGWFFKYIILKYGGLRGHRMARPLFLGLIFGEYFVGGLWLVVGLITSRGYKILPT